MGEVVLLSNPVLFFLPEHTATPSPSLSRRRLPRSVSQSLESFAVAHLRSLDAKHTNTHPRRRNPRQHRGSLSVAAGWQLEHKHFQLDSVSAGGVGWEGCVWVCWGWGGPHSSSLCHHTARAEATQNHYTMGHVLVLTTSAACEQPSATFL